MAVPRVHQSAFTPGEIEFVAGNEKITIIPKAKMSKMSLVQGKSGPFQPPLTAEVAIWLALIMKKNNKCSIVCPDWLSLEFLKAKHEHEEQDLDFSTMPFHYMEIAQMLLETAPDDIPNAEQVRTILKDIRETRQAKARLGIKELDESWLGMKNFSCMEVNEVRPIFCRAYDEIRKLSEIDDVEEEDQSTQGTNTTF
ncbi:DNA replication complex GINS protein PSF2 [Mucor mucedo]|uniref:DNA replication complex GINS protein PSF2 n=1 Tax=Mucor mucedo TaxID=29922 RepID=UPI00221F16E0|nr:DNA replication complex GINS protein PSF2 [Mucor mucedo]KAI7888917.1 DNA replication complex GINS protein PSF2 [Mucor mucedo]